MLTRDCVEKLLKRKVEWKIFANFREDLKPQTKFCGEWEYVWFD